MANLIAEARQQREAPDSRESRADILSVLSEMLSQPDLDEHKESDRNIEVTDIYNRLASNCNLRGYFQQAESALGLVDSQDTPLPNESSATFKSLDYVVPGNPKFSNDDSKKLYLYVFRIVEAKRRLKLVYRMIEQQRLKSIGERLQVVPDLRRGGEAK